MNRHESRPFPPNLDVCEEKTNDFRVFRFGFILLGCVRMVKIEFGLVIRKWDLKGIPSSFSKLKINAWVHSRRNEIT